MRSRLLAVVLFALLGAMVFGADSVLVGRGIDVRDVLLPGPELRVKKSRGFADSVVVRITGTYPHGTVGFRYDFHCVSMAAGKHDITQFLETQDGQPAKGLQPVLVEATEVLPAGPPGELSDAPASRPPKRGGYEAMIPWGIALWAVAGIGAFLYFRKRKKVEQAAAMQTGPTLVEQVRVLIERAIAQPLGTPEKADLERLLLAHGRDQLGLAEATDPTVWSALRSSPKTASWLKTLESWLHRPVSSPPSEAELRELLARIN